MEAHSTRTLALLSLLALSSCGFTHEWVETAGTLRVPAQDVARIRAKLHNGTLSSAGTPEKIDVITVRYRVRAGGRDIPDAEACLRAIELVHTADKSGTLRLEHRFSVEKKDGWAASVNFDLEQSTHTPIEARTHNGTIVIDGVRAALQVETHNGSVRVTGAEAAVGAVSHNGNIAIDGGSEIQARSHNGRVRVRTSAQRVELATHNGGVTAELTATPITGSISTHNGPIRIRVLGDGPVEIEATGADSEMQIDDGFEDVHAERKRGWARRGKSSGKVLHVTTKNGVVDIRSR